MICRNQMYNHKSIIYLQIIIFDNITQTPTKFTIIMARMNNKLAIFNRHTTKNTSYLFTQLAKEIKIIF